MNNLTIGVFPTRLDAEAAINELTEIGVDGENISYVYIDESGKQKEKGVGGETAKDAAGGATTGAVVGALAGLAVANGVLPGLGSLFVAGPLAAALGLTGVAATTASGAITGAAAGGLIGALTGLGVGSKEAKDYEERVKNGEILVTAISPDPKVKNAFEGNNAEEIREYKVKE